MKLISCVRYRTYLSNCVSPFLMYFNTVVESLYNGILLTGILISWTIVLKRLATIKAASNSSLRIVNEGLFIGVNLDFANTKLQLTLLIAFIYATAPYAFSDASANMCSSTGCVEKDLYHRSILTSFKFCILCFQMFQRVRISSHISSSQSILRFQSSCINNFDSRMAGEIIPKGSNMLLVKLSIPCFVFGTSLYNTFTFRTSSFWSQRITKALSSGILSKSRSTSFGDKMLFGSDFKIL